MPAEPTKRNGVDLSVPASTNRDHLDRAWPLRVRHEPKDDPPAWRNVLGLIKVNLPAVGEITVRRVILQRLATPGLPLDPVEVPQRLAAELLRRERSEVGPLLGAEEYRKVSPRGRQARTPADG